ncbi:MAG: head GIN domain-containing protein [Cellulophaga sp.]
MKNLILLLVLLTGYQSVIAQNEKITQELQEFTKIKGFDGLSINLIKSDVNRAVITGVNTGKVSIVNNKGVLKLKMEIVKIFSGYRTFIDLYYTETLAVLDVNEDARITSEEIIKQTVLELKSQEGGELIIATDVEQLLIKVVSGGVITTSGVSTNQDVKINTGGTYKGENLKTSLTTVSVNAGGTAEIFASDYVKAIVKAGGVVKVHGNPKKMDEKTVFGGKIKRM